MAESFPTDIQEFDGDDRISFSRLDNKFIAVQDDGTELEFDSELKRWVPAEEHSPDEHPVPLPVASTYRNSQAGSPGRDNAQVSQPSSYHGATFASSY